MDRRRVGLTLVLLLLADSANGQVCGGILTAPPGGTVATPNYPDPYPNSANCQWTIAVPEGKLVQLTFDSFHTDSGRAKLVIYDGGSASATPLGRQLDGDITPAPITGTSNQMFLYFYSNAYGSGSATGFQISYTATDTQACGGALTAPPGGTVTSPNYLGYYGDFAICHWTITVPEGSLVQLTFDHFQIEEIQDELIIYDGSSDSAPQVQSLSGWGSPQPITSTSNQMFLRFASNRYDRGENGFQISYTATDTPACGGILSAPPGGTVATPNFPNKFSNMETCLWTITVPEGSLVQLTFDTFNVGGHGARLTIYNGGSASAPRLNRLTGNFPVNPITGTSNQMFLKFTSDATTEYWARGFQLSYSATDTPACGGTLSAPPGGTVTSPNYPGQWGKMGTCHWTITVPEGSLVLLTFAAYDLGAYDDLTIFDGASDSDAPLSIVADRGSLPNPITGTSNQMFLRLTAPNPTGTFTGDGFQISYTATDTPACGGILTASPGGTVTSHNYPDEYPDVTCEWTITAAEGSIVQLTFDSFMLDTGYHHLSIYDGGSDSAPRLRSFTGDSLPDPITGTSNQMFLKLTVDKQDGGDDDDYYGGYDYGDTTKGFQISYAASVDRCADGSHNCGPQETCYNTADSFTCTVCQDPLGMVSGAIPDGSITASSSYYPQEYQPHLARLDGQNGWAPLNAAVGEWLQVDLGEVRPVTGIITQGHTYGYVVKSYKLQHSTDGASWTTYADGEGTEVFTGNTDYGSPVRNLLDNPVQARYVRLLPQTWETYIGIRAEILGCKQETPEETPDCPTLYPGLKPSHNFGVYQNQCFWSGSFRTPRLNYMAAKQACQDEGGTLAMIKDEATQTFLRAHLRSTSGHRQRSYWIGLDDLNTEGTFLWNDETPLGDYDKFRSDAPNESRDCVSLWRSRRRARWDIKDCNTRRPYICQLSGNGDK